MLCHSSSRSVCNPSNSRVQVPFFDHRSNRLNTVFHGPNSMGRSRHGTPVRRHHKTASTNFRLSFPRRPGPRFSARTKAIFAHFRSSNWSRTIDFPLEHTRQPMESHFSAFGHGQGHGHVSALVTSLTCEGLQESSASGAALRRRDGTSCTKYHLASCARLERTRRAAPRHRNGTSCTKQHFWSEKDYERLSTRVAHAKRRDQS